MLSMVGLKSQVLVSHAGAEKGCGVGKLGFTMLAVSSAKCSIPWGPAANGHCYVAGQPLPPVKQSKLAYESASRLQRGSSLLELLH